MGSIFGGGSTTVNQSSSSEPWGPQQGYILQTMQDAQALYNQQKGAQYPTASQLYVPINSTQQAGVNAGVQTGNGLLSAGNSLLGTGSNAAGYLSQVGGNLSPIASGNFNPGSTAAGSNASSITPASTAATVTGLIGALSSAGQDPTAANIASAGQYANNPVIQQQIDAALTDVRRNLGENVLPTLNSQAISTGNINSSRAGAAEAIAQRSADEQAAQTAAQIRGNAYNQGLQLAEQARQANLSGNLSAAGVGNQATATGIAGDTAANTNRLGNYGLQIAANNGLLSTAGAGSGMATTGANLSNLGVSGLLGAGGILQQDQQAQNNAQIQNWQGSLQLPWQLLGNEANLVASRSWGGSTTGTSTSTNSGNPIGGILGLGALAAAPFTGGTSLLSSIGSGLSSIGGIGEGLGALSGATGITSGLLSGPAVGASTLSPYWRGLMASAA